MNEKYFTLPYLTLLYLTLPHLTLPYPTLSYPTLPYLTSPHITLPCHALLHFTLLYFTLLHFTSLHFNLLYFTKYSSSFVFSQHDMQIPEAGTALYDAVYQYALALDRLHRNGSNITAKAVIEEFRRKPYVGKCLVELYCMRTFLSTPGIGWSRLCKKWIALC